MGGTVAVTNIGELVTNDPVAGEGTLGVIRSAALVVRDGEVAWCGDARDVLSHTDTPPLDAGGRSVIPGFVDCHSHIMFAGDRSAEFAARMAGTPYAAGGIRTTVAATRAASDDLLRSNAQRLIAEMRAGGTTTLEIKSGYGLDVDTEERSVRIAAELCDDVTFMGAHVVPAEFEGKSDAYVDLVCGPMLDACAPHATWIDVFCEAGAFTEDQSERILRAGTSAGLRPRIHLNQLGHGDAVAMAIGLDCASADHLTFLTDDDVAALAASETVAGLVPAADFSTRAPQYPRGRDLLDAGAVVALSPDCNPGSSYTTSMAFTIALAVREMHLTCDEALYAATVGGATALRRSDVGHLRQGASGDFTVLNAPSHTHLAYRPGVPLTSSTWRRGSAVYRTEGPL